MNHVNARSVTPDTHRRENGQPAAERHAPARSHEQHRQGTQRRAATTAHDGVLGAGVLGDTQCSPSCDCIRARAFEIFQARTAAGLPGDAASDWLHAEEELRIGATPNPAQPDEPLLIEAGRPAGHATSGRPVSVALGSSFC